MHTYTANPKRSSSLTSLSTPLRALTSPSSSDEYSSAKNVAVNPKKTKLGFPEVEYVGHLVSATGTLFTPEKRLKVLDFPQPTTQKAMLQFISLANYFRDHVPHMTEMVKHRGLASSSGQQRALHPTSIA
jgi:hypothetical protein